MNKVFTENGWKDYAYWQTEDRKTLKKINQLIENICRNGNEGIGKPEPLTGNLSGFWSRRINDKDRLIEKKRIFQLVDIIIMINSIVTKAPTEEINYLKVLFRVLLSIADFYNGILQIHITPGHFDGFLL